MLTKNFQKLKAEVAAHVAADRVAQGSYKTCFIGCLANGTNNPGFIETEYGIPLIVTLIAESIFEGLCSNEAADFFAALPEAVGSDGKDLTRVSWQFLAAELRALPPVPDDIQACIDSVIEGMDLLADGKEWSEAVAAARSAARAAAAARSAARAARAADAFAFAAFAAFAAAFAFAADAAFAAAEAAAFSSAARAADAATFAADVADAAAAFAADVADAAAAFAADAADDAADAADAAVRLRQRNTLLQLIKEAPINTQEENE